MGFLLQLRILLWKNLTLKRRSPLVLLFELVIPLVLFVILLCIRYKQPAYAMPDSHTPTKPLPSAGILAVMQEFCAGGVYDNQRFKNFPKSTVNQFLQNFQSVAESNNFFDPGFKPSDLDHLPELYHRIIDDPAMLHDKIIQLQSLELNSLLLNMSDLVNELAMNLSIPADVTDSVLSSKLNVSEVYRILFGDYSERRRRSSKTLPSLKDYLPLPEGGWKLPSLPSLDLDAMRTSEDYSKMASVFIDHAVDGKVLTDTVRSYIPALSFLPDKGLMFQLLADNPQLLLDPEFRRIITGLAEAAGRNELDKYFAGRNPTDWIHLVQKMRLSSSSLHRWTCINDELSRLLLAASQKDTLNVKYFNDLICSFPESKWSTLLAILKQHVSIDSDLNKLELKNVNTSVFTTRIQHFEDNLEKFLLFEKNLLMLSNFASGLPQTSCKGDVLPSNPSITLNVGSVDDVTTAYIDTTVFTTSDSPTMENSMNATTSDSSAIGNDNYGDEPSAETVRNAGLIRIWIAMQNTLCGFSTVNEENISKLSRDIKIDDLGLTQTQMNSIGMLVHALYSNPKVLYAPNNTAANIIMNKVNGTFELLDVITEFSRKWLKVSADIRAYLMLNKTENNIQEIVEMQRILRQLPVVLRMLHSQAVREFLSRPLDSAEANRTVFLHQLDVVDNAACSWISLVRGINVNVFQGFATEEELVNYFLHDAYSDQVTILASVVFKNLNEHTDTLPPHIIYKIRQNASFTDNTKFVRDKYWHPGPGDSSDKYYHFGFVWLQDMVERAIIDVQTGRDVLEPGTFVHQMPHPCYMEDRFLFMIEHVMPLCLTISWVYTVSMLVQSIVYEKEHRLKEVMRMMGLNNSVHWLAWFLTTFAQMSVTMAVLTVMLKYGNVLMYSNAFITFLVLEVFAVATIWFSFLVSACYSKAKVAAACAGILYFISYVPYMYVAIREEAAGDKISAAVKSLVSLLSTTAFGLGAKYFAFYEIEGVGVQWDNMAISPVEGDQYNLQLVILMMVFDALLYGLLTWYIENVHPGTIGLPKPWYFPFTKSYWFGSHGQGTDAEKHWWDRLFNGYTRLSVVEDDQACAMDDSLEGSHYNFESEPQHLFCGVHVNRLKKIYKKDKIAVNNLSFNLYEDQITSFLGHNGAGKTTTMSILTGLFPPTSGYATVYGLDIRSDMDEIRRNLGMCPQHNLLFDKLTVEEHLWLYARLKGMVASEIKTETDRMINDLGLPKKRHSSVDCLSGGMKRKLSVAIAFVAGSRTVILDEPTAGVDPYARRAIWDLIIKYKEGRTILLSTHHMDEADILGDRIAIISNGELKCCGSSSFLKSTFGDGYHLVLVKKHSEEDLRSADTLSFDETRLHFHSRCCEEKLTTFICQYVQSAYVKNETNHELHYILPFDEAKKGGYERLFSALDASLSELHVASYGIADTNLEEVFLKITAESLPKANPTDDGEGSLEEVPRVPLSTSTTRQVSASDSDITSLQSHYLLDGAAGVELNRIGSVSVTSNNLMDSQTISYNELVSGVRDQPDVPLLIPTAEFRRSMDSLNMDCDEDVPLLVPDCKSPSHKTDSNETRDPDVQKYGVSAAGGRRYRGHVLSGSSLYMQQFIAILIKRFYYIHRNWKGMFSQILLPAMFVSVAMTVALTAPQVLDLPAIVLSPAQYYNYTQPRGNFIPVSVAPKSSGRSWSKDASASDIAATFHLASGIGSTCVLKSPFNSSFDADILRAVNFTSQSQRLLEKYFNPGCGSVFVEGISLMNFVPPATVVIQPSSFKNDSILDVTSNPNRDKYHPECTCTTDHTGQICTTDGFELPPSYQAVTAEYVQDISGENEEEYYLTTQDMYRLHRYGAFSLGLAQESVPESFGKYGPTQFRKLAVRHTSMAWFDNKGYHSMPVYLNALNNAILRANLPREKGNKAAYGITVINHPMNNTNNQLSLEYIKQGSDVLIAIFVICAMSFVPASFVVFLVYERSIKAKHLEIVSGLNRVIYWIANYVWDMFNYLIPGACCIIILKVFDIPAYVSSTNLPAVMALFLLYGWSITPMMYPASFIFNEPSTAYICLIVINLFIGMTCIITSFLLELFQQNSPDLAYIHDILKNVFLVFPNYCLGRGLMDIAFNEYRNEFFFKIGMYDEMKSPFEWKLTARNLVAMAAMGFVFFIITLLCEFNFFIKKRSRLVDDNAGVAVPHDEDADVTQERRRVLRGRGRHDLLQLKNLSKVYITRKLGQQQAVDHISLGVPAGECFGLLGVNGAGKTTTFRMLTGDLEPSGGDATLDGYSILKDIYKVQQNIGYCPQFDALYDELTAREHLQLYSRLRGIPRQQQSQVVNWALEKLGLTAYADKMSGTYSGGNKRKLSTAIALLGRPPIVFMDEPTTGMDPCSRRFLWNLIIDLIHEGTSVILTSHSMEECEVLCTRLAVMVNGRLQCLGSAQHLKNKYGDGYSMLIRMRSNNSERDVTAIKHFVTHHLPNARFKECHHNVIQYEFPSAGLSLAAIFSEMEKASRDLPIDDYSISQNTLDNVFINFVKQQQELIEESASVIDTDPLVSLSTSHDLSSDSSSQPVVVQSRNSSTDVTMSSTRTPDVEYVDSQSTSDIGCRSNCIPDIIDDDEDSVSQLWLDSTGVRLAFLNTGSSN